jgi:hypothetical protein
VGDRGDDDRGHQHEPYGEQEDRPEVEPEVAPGGKERLVVEQRWQKEQEDKLWVELDRGKPRHEAQGQPAQDQQDRVGHSDSLGQRGEDDHGQQQAQGYLHPRQSFRTPFLSHQRSARPDPILIRAQSEIELPEGRTRSFTPVPLVPKTATEPASCSPG